MQVGATLVSSTFQDRVLLHAGVHGLLVLLLIGVMRHLVLVVDGLSRRVRVVAVGWSAESTTHNMLLVLIFHAVTCAASAVLHLLHLDGFTGTRGWILLVKSRLVLGKPSVLGTCSVINDACVWRLQGSARLLELALVRVVLRHVKRLLL